MTVTLTGTGELTDVSRSRPAPSTASDADSLTDLGDLVVAAYRDGKAKVDELASRALGPLAGGGLGGDDRQRRPAARRLRCMRVSSRT